ncbi:hypothetical protein [Clostridium manihotivorum]|uniref:YhfM-like domain-containing protein n=1 Tax=Clostridium manihotivorum TaxID=2320868 RepID=A0A3R5QW25_9CLOT|nr:hypothetical protein [Clostridium manihotivorum]QAA33594.1 hypothetical protein C1I91_19210 [Clostridium manihotivorum]
MKLLLKSKIFITIILIFIVLAVCIIFYRYKDNESYRSSEVSNLIINKLAQNSPKTIIDTWNFKDKKHIARFINAFNSKKRLNVKFDIRTPDYSITIVLTNNHEENYNLWLDDTSEGLIMNDNKVWQLSKSSTESMRKLLK